MPDDVLPPFMKERLTPMVQRAITSFINERIDDRLKRALIEDPVESTLSGAGADNQSNGEPSEVELKGFDLIKKLLAEYVDAQRLFVRDQQTYCAILLDDNRRRTICRLRFNQRRPSRNHTVRSRQRRASISPRKSRRHYQSQRSDACYTANVLATKYGCSINRSFTMDKPLVVTGFFIGVFRSNL